MSKLRANITQKHHINSDSSILTSLSIIIHNEKENNNKKEVEEDLLIIDDSSNEEKKEEKENKKKKKKKENLEKEFNNYLQRWSEILKEETHEFENNEDEIVHIIVDDTLYPAIDFNAK